MSEITMFVGNLDRLCDSEMLAQWFDRAGIKPIAARIAMDRKLNRSKGFAFVDILEEQQQAAEKLNGELHMGRKITVERSRSGDGVQTKADVVWPGEKSRTERIVDYRDWQRSGRQPGRAF